MSKYRRAANVDLNQNSIVESLRKLGYTVELGHDDILVGANGKTYWFELKDEKHISKSTGKPYPYAVKPSQKKLLENWKGHYKIVWSLDMILDDISG